ncbi:MAG: hypothetical protein SFX73_36365 [Kofleriaceae bacterium]|nr:hypothetical protein [Kofleriaceae bacterium]
MGLGGVLLAAYVLQAWVGSTPAWLASLQASDRYRVISGGALALYILRQTFVGRRRRLDPAGALARHRLGGALAPLVLYLHAARFAYGYLLLLAYVYLTTVLLGLLYRPMQTSRARRLYVGWFLTHVAAAASLVVLGGFHVAIALGYE